MMRISQREKDGVLILDLYGKAVAGSAQLRMQRAIEAAIAGGNSRILCNLARVSVMDMAGVGALAAGYVKAQAVGGELALLDPQNRVMNLLVLCGLGDKFRIVRSVDRVVAAFSRSEDAVRSRPSAYRAFERAIRIAIQP